MNYMNQHQEELNRKKVLITGGCGFIGSNLIPRLNALGCYTVSVDTQAPRFRACLPNRYYRADVRSLSDMINIFRTERPDIVFHLAAVSTVDAGNLSPIDSLSVNGVGTMNILKSTDAVQKLTGRKVILCVSSTDKVMKGLPQNTPYTEETPVCPSYQSAYDVGKATEELLVSDFASQGNHTVILRQCNVLGPMDLIPTRILPAVCKALVYDDPITIRRCRLKDGSVSEFYRTYLSVEDLIDAYLDAVCRLIRNPSPEYGGLWCVAPSRKNAASVSDFVARVANQFEKRFDELEIRYQDVEIGKEIRYQVIDASKWERDFGWTPATDLDQILKQVVPFYQHYYAAQKALTAQIIA